MSTKEQIISAALRGDILRLRPNAFIPADKEVRGTKAIPDGGDQNGTLKLISADPGSTMVTLPDADEGVALDALIEEQPDIFIGSGLELTTLPFEVAQVTTGHWSIGRWVTLAKRYADELGVDDHNVESVFLDRRGRRNHHVAFRAIEKMMSRISVLHDNGRMAPETFKQFDSLFNQMVRGAFAVRAGYTPQGMTPADGFAIVQMAGRGARMYHGFERNLTDEDCTAIRANTFSVRRLLNDKGLSENQWARFQPGDPIGFTGDVQALLIQPYPRETVFLDDWGRKPYDHWESRGVARDRKDDVMSMGVIKNRRQRRLHGSLGRIESVRDYETGTASYSLRKQLSNDDGVYDLSSALYGAPAYVIGLSGWTVVESNSGAEVRLQKNEVVMVPPMAGGEVNVLMTSGVGVNSSALILRPLR